MSDKSALELERELSEELTTEHGHTINTIFLIAEIIRRETFVELGYGSIWDYLRRVHKQSDTMIYYRLRCAEAVNRFPQVSEPLRSGNLCMTTLAKLTEVLDENNCEALLAEALGKSRKEAERIVARERPQPIPKDFVTPVTSTFLGKSIDSEPGPAAAPSTPPPTRTEALTESFSRVYMAVDQDYLDLLKEMRGALSHKMPGAADFEILKECMQIARKALKKRKGILDKPRADRVADDGTISQSVKRIVEQRDQGKCQWRSEDGGICGSTYRVEFHHKQDRARGGAGTPENVILLCEKHHLLATEIAWGEEFIGRFRKRPRERAADERQSQIDFR